MPGGVVKAAEESAEALRSLNRASDVATGAPPAPSTGLKKLLAQAERRTESLPEVKVFRDDQAKELGFPDTQRTYGLSKQANNLNVEIRGDTFRVMNSQLTEEFRGRGLGLKMYMKAAEDAKQEGLAFESDAVVAQDAQNVWEALKRRGYDVQVNPKAERTPRGSLVVVGGEPVYRIEPIKSTEGGE